MARRNRPLTTRKDSAEQGKGPSTPRRMQIVRPRNRTWPVQWQMWLIAGGLAAMVGLVFGRCASFEFLAVGDDSEVVRASPLQRGLWECCVWAFDPRASSPWQPLVRLSH